MANYASNIFLARTKNERDLQQIDDYIAENFCGCYMQRNEDCLQSEFYSKWTYPAEMIDKLIDSLKSKNDIYIRVLSFDLEDEYAEFRIFSNGKWNIKQ